ncbi:hypothetical protein [Kitasatospora griseola]|uniref:hypothetical protein n=1 Tax=Kitasatospora griseola TaxID=2064 RepID=UPI0034398F7E
MTSPARTHPLTAPRPPDSEHQRVGFARTQGRKTRLLAFDHATGSLDATADHTTLAPHQTPRPSPTRTHPLTAPRRPAAPRPNGNRQQVGLAHAQSRDTRQPVLDHATGDLGATADHTALAPHQTSRPGGERQRVGLARTQGRDTRLPAFDHATDDLDTTADHTTLAALRSRLHPLAPYQPPRPSPAHRAHRALLTTDPTGPTP